MSDKPPSHSTKLSKDDSQVAGYDKPPSHSTKLSKDDRRVAGYDSVVIPKEQLTAFERWELASFDSHPGDKHQGGTKRSTALSTVAELENIRQQAHDEGHAQGREAGYAAGIQQARNEAAQIHALLQNI